MRNKYVYCFFAAFISMMIFAGCSKNQNISNVMADDVIETPQPTPQPTVEPTPTPDPYAKYGYKIDDNGKTIYMETSNLTISESTTFEMCYKDYAADEINMNLNFVYGNAIICDIINCVWDVNEQGDNICILTLCPSANGNVQYVISNNNTNIYLNVCVQDYNSKINNQLNADYMMVAGDLMNTLSYLLSVDSNDLSGTMTKSQNVSQQLNNYQPYFEDMYNVCGNDSNYTQYKNYLYKLAFEIPESMTEATSNESIRYANEIKEYSNTVTNFTQLMNSLPFEYDYN